MSFDDTEGLRKKIRALIVFRVIFVTLLLGSSYLFKGVENVASIHAFSYIVVSFYFVTIIYSLLLGRIRNFFFFGYVQLIIDIFLETALIYITGGIESWFSFLLIFSVIASSIVLNKKAGYVSATLSCVLYGVLLNLQLFKVLPLIPDTVVEAQDYFYNIFVHVVSLYLTAYLSGYLSSALEKTEQKLEEKKLDFRDLEFFNREVIENMQSGLFTTDMSGTVMIFNRAAENILGVEKGEIIGKRIDSVVPFFEFPFSEGRKENSIYVNNQEKIIGLGISTLTGGDTQPKGYIIIFQDLTELKLLEMEMKQREKWAAIGELSSNIAHEIRNPLASLRGSIEMLKEDTVPGNYKTRLMEIAVNEMDRLNRIITDFLTYSRPSPPELKEFDLHELLDETTELLKNLEHRGLKIQKRYSGKLQISADPQKIRQVFWNLGLNAMEAMPAEGELVISTESTDGFATITFRDTGPGIGTEDLEKIFYPFFTTKEQGTGLGLAIAYRIVEEHRGSIKIKSTPGSGSTFEIILPKAHEKS